MIVDKIPAPVKNNKDKGKAASSSPPSACSPGSAPARHEGRPNLRWTRDLHGAFVEAVTALGGPQSKNFIISSPIASC
ncbi:unnamed protein product [Linum tenue]|uniref:Uncharacterized protein n=1 Tax=Linum tenue TaxID=586396 RepID=A0AAV0NZD6_9ROSI|nr:unnamed protein product [Linum tenue]